MEPPFSSNDNSNGASSEYHVEDPREIQLVRKSSNIETVEESFNEGEEEEEEGGVEEETTTTFLQRPSREAKIRAQLIMEEQDDRDFSLFEEKKKPYVAKHRTSTTSSTTTKSKAKPPQNTNKPNKKNTSTKPKKKVKNSSSNNDNDTSNSSDFDSDDDKDADFVSVEKGDCILMDSGDHKTFYVALVHAIHAHGTSKKNPGEFTAQWYYQPRDLRKETLALIQDQLLPNEVFLTPHRDKNSMDAIIGLCHVVSPEEYESIQSEIKRGYREKNRKEKFFVCRYKYKLTGPPQKALEPLKAFEVNRNQKKTEPRVGQAYQVEIPNQIIQKKKKITTKLPEEQRRQQQTSSGENNSLLVWSPLMEVTHQLILGQYRSMLNNIRFAVGNIVKTFRTTDETMGHVRCIILRFDNDSTTCIPNQPKVCTSDGHVLDLTISSLCSPLSDDVAYKMLYTNKFNVCHAVHGCVQILMNIQEVERRAFKREVVLYKEIQRSMSNGSIGKRYSIRQTYGDDELEEEDEGDSGSSDSKSRRRSQSSSSSRNKTSSSHEEPQIKQDPQQTNEHQAYHHHHHPLQGDEDPFNIFDGYDEYNIGTNSKKQRGNVKEI